MFGITQLLTDKPKFNCRSIWLLCEWFNLCVKFSWEPCWDSPGEINFQSTHSTKEMQKKLSTNEWDKQVRQAGSSHRDREWWMTDCLPAHPVKAQPHGWLRVRRTNTRNWSGIDLRCPLLSSCGGINCYSYWEIAQVCVLTTLQFQELHSLRHWNLNRVWWPLGSPRFRNLV
jgi:hypothetical protein